MRLMMTEEMQKLWNEIKPYIDFSQEDGFRPDTPYDIKQKDETFKKLNEKQWNEAMKIELGLI